MNKLLLGLATIFLFACSKNSNNSQLRTPPAQLKVDKSSLKLSGIKPSVDSFSIEYSGNWKISFNPSTVSWLKATPGSGSGNALIHVTAEEDNTTGADRSATIIVTPDGDASKAVNVGVTQHISNTLWSKLYGGSGNDFFTNVTQTPDGGYIAIGTNASTDGDVSSNKNSRDVWAVRVDANGNKVWEKSYGGTNSEDGASIAKTSDGNFVIAAYSSSTDGDISINKGRSDLFVFKIDGNGSILWKKTFGGSLGEYTSGNTFIAATSDGGSVIAASSDSNDGDVSGNHGIEDVWIIKLDQSGTIVWNKTFGGTHLDEAHGITSSPDGGFLVVGFTASDEGDVSGNHVVGTWDAWVLKIDVDGNKQWQKPLGGTNNENAFAVTTTSDNGFILAASAVSTDGDVSNNHGMSDAWIVKIDSSGNKLWAKTYGGSGNDGVSSIIRVNNGFLVAGQTESTDGDVIPTNGIVGAWIFQIDDNGAIVWQKNFGGTNGGGGITIIPTADGKFVVTGSTSSNDGDVSGNHGQIDAWIFKISGN